MQPIIVIPSRIASTRLPRKALAEIDGEPMIVHVARRAVAAGLGPVLVAAGDEEIRDAVAGMAGVKAILTDPALPSGSDRVQAAIEAHDPQRRHDCVINLQGDLPLVEPETLQQALRPLAEGRFDIGTLVAPVQGPEERDAESVVKVACSFQSDDDVARALYFSRSVIPWGEGVYWHHVGVYAWRREALARFVTLPPSGLEEREKLEQLRALEAGMTIGCARIATAPLGVDTPEDLARVRARVGEQPSCR
ncbi:3-deoxy-manno-octulosonate cytidylyltransferase [Parasaccharibacter sp. TMW2.1882]|uniref:3-deoxy-manno-octulosonate cytidylyltransferase n=2 Tax=Acetobacteraceae TaxID=433 RepID=A0ABX4ZMD3_9PROT|nr:MULTISPECIES: 3-deoxy-manno-octulosonate cytidylyltransferase [Acetobacteraceae]MBE1723105.1 3-deoxy-manno-octulosonate cytidylyltransferase [Bombella apis]MBR9730912.1 3-deoxy-manno-octulosonate cytidylyltransferase [Bombella apis]MCK8636596.1 3-deoxy-manno-octulosonate cytidylyltransferase [Parasaccharibacter sp. TMW2.1885]MCL1496361.1 3-deoxy-manno-octulosonate cytidylyltransferase [Parasaccharibacter sp. TMW2.1882]MCL1514783.1 3-deoxy-manno-octulosonate cytidylyltransferase [Parasacchar